MNDRVHFRLRKGALLVFLRFGRSAVRFLVYSFCHFGSPFRLFRSRRVILGMKKAAWRISAKLLYQLCLIFTFSKTLRFFL